MDVPALACDLGTFSASERALHRELTRNLHARMTGVEELRDGFALKFNASTRIRRQLLEWIDLERSCCPYLNLTVREATAEKSLLLRLTGPPGTKEFLAVRLGIEARPGESVRDADLKTSAGFGMT